MEEKKDVFDLTRQTRSTKLTAVKPSSRHLMSPTAGQLGNLDFLLVGLNALSYVLNRLIKSTKSKSLLLSANKSHQRRHRRTISQASKRFVSC